MKQRQKLIKKLRSELRKANRPESEMNALFRQDLAATNKLFSTAKHQHKYWCF